MPARLDPFVDVMLRERADQLYLLPDEPVTLVKDGKPRKVSKQPLTDQHIYALMVEVAPPEAADKIDQNAETEFEYAAGDSLVRVRIVPEAGRLTAVISAIRRASQEQAAPTVETRAAAARPALSGPAARSAPTVSRAASPAPPVPSGPPAPPAQAEPPRAPRASVIAAAPMVESPAALPSEFGNSQYQVAEQKLGKLLRALVQSSSSDLHLRVGEPPLFRTHGVIKRQDGTGGALSVNDLELLVLSIMPERNRGEWKETGDTDFAYEIAGLARFRVNAARDRKGPVAVFRVIPAKVVTVEEMGLTEEVQRLCYLTKGLVLVTGPTGSGKSTTLCALIDLVNRTRSDHIITIEDPIEFVHENKKCLITQRQVHVHTDSFKSALRAALREDPDIVLVGEMRDLETIAIAIETAETGHLVFGTLHTTTAASTVDRIIDQFPADRQAQIRVMLSESLKGVISQTLCKKVGGGRVAAREILLSTPAIANLIREGKTFQIPSIIQTSKKLGMNTLNDALLELVEKKAIEPDEAYMKSVEKAGLTASLKAKGFKVTLTPEA
ncbi:MAG TPA: type IV pilus twitching motility protein PilT [Gemmatimonadales bacterium]|jgi:twitching motility protein PilT|nr:type IV pilus twitching motility protein PilT [Gemmatimonadales bacterium]